MRFYSIEKKKPDHLQECIVKVKAQAGYLVTQTNPYTYYDIGGFGSVLPVVEWAPWPQHIGFDSAGWKSEYMGDELPKRSGWCMVSLNDSKLVRQAYFDAKIGRFLSYNDIVGFMEI